MKVIPVMKKMMGKMEMSRTMRMITVTTMKKMMALLNIGK